MDYDYNDRKQASVYSRRLKAGKRRTYFFDVRETRGNDFFLTITESRKRFNADGYERHKIFLYKEDFNKFEKALGEAVDHVKTELMPNYDFDSFSHEGEDQDEYNAQRERSATQESQHTHNATDTNAVAESQPSLMAEPETSAINADMAVMEAEPMQESVTPQNQEAATHEISNKERDIINATATSNKLASEEVEKW